MDNQNVIQGTPNSTNCIVVLQPNGQPANGKNNTPISPVFGGGLLGTAYGIDIDQNDSVWVGDFGWGPCTGCIPSAGAVSQLHLNGTPISGSSGYTSYIYRAQGVVSDKNNNIWIASYGNDRIVVFPKGNPNEAFYYQEPPNSGPFDIVLDSDGAAWVSNSGSAIVNKFIIQNNQIVNALSVPVGNQLKGITIDSQNNIWLASFGNNTVYELDPSGTIIHTVNGVGGIEAPWGVRVDSDDNVWVANFTDFLTVNHYSISEICGSKPSNCPLGLTTGDAITPVSGYTLPTGGSQVLLANGTPLNGPHGPPSYFPLMRLTQVIPDRAGNIWAANNWKPIPYSSHFANPGGDGMVAFIGLGKPTEDVQ